jgi:hypothetical protein
MSVQWQRRLRRARHLGIDNRRRPGLEKPQQKVSIVDSIDGITRDRRLGGVAQPVACGTVCNDLLDAVLGGRDPVIR